MNAEKIPSDDDFSGAKVGILSYLQVFFLKILVLSAFLPESTLRSNILEIKRFANSYLFSALLAALQTPSTINTIPRFLPLRYFLAPQKNQKEPGLRQGTVRT